MKNLLVLLIIFFATIAGVSGQSPVTLTKAEAQEDLKWLRYSLEYVHPRLYKYDDKKTVDQRFDSLLNAVKNDISGLDFLSLVSKLNASVNCGHLYTIPQSELRNEVRDKKVMPFYVKLVGDDFYIFNDCSSDKSIIENGSKLISVNGKPIADIYNLMLPGIATDGYIETRKRRLIERYYFSAFQGFDLYYHIHVDRSSTFEIEYAENETSRIKRITKKGISADERKKKLLERYGMDQDVWFKRPSPQIEIVEDKNYALLTISRSFYDDKIDPNYDFLLSKSFKKLKERDIENLIIDLRNNEGGSEHQQMELMSYLYDQPFKLYENIYQSNIDFRPLKQIILERDTSQLLFNNDDEYMRKLTGNLWVNNYKYSKNLQLQPPKKVVFDGQIYVLMNGGSFSSAADLISDIKKTTNAIFIGEESGGTFEGPTGGITIAVQLPNSKIMVRISPNIHLGYMYQKHPIGRGVLPDYEIEYTIDDLLNGKDLEMEKALNLILERQ
ncbi:MAG: S41 family peptidase [Bacteroidota bacterium]